MGFGCDCLRRDIFVLKCSAPASVITRLAFLLHPPPSQPRCCAQQLATLLAVAATSSMT